VPLRQLEPEKSQLRALIEPLPLFYLQAIFLDLPLPPASYNLLLLV
jgi:hypothetical protein